MMARRIDDLSTMPIFISFTYLFFFIYFFYEQNYNISFSYISTKLQRLKLPSYEVEKSVINSLNISQQIHNNAGTSL